MYRVKILGHFGPEIGVMQISDEQMRRAVECLSDDIRCEAPSVPTGEPDPSLVAGAIGPVALGVS